MPSALSHPAVPLGIWAAAGRIAVPGRLLAAACAASVLPDVDALGYWAGIPYGAPLGHRGFTHSLAFALAMALVAARFAPRLRVRAPTAFAVVLLAALSHGVLDAMTTGGLGVAFFSPVSSQRYFLPLRVIEVSPIGVRPFLSARGLSVLGTELRWVWAPSALVGIAGLLIRRGARRA